MDFTELHLHTAYSFLDGASQPEELLDRARELGYSALAITDHDNLAGAMAFAQYARSIGVQPVTGVEMTLVEADVSAVATADPPQSPRPTGGGLLAALRAPMETAHSRSNGTNASYPQRRASPRFTGGLRGVGPQAALRVHHLTLLAETPTGYANICRLVTDACDPQRRPSDGEVAPIEGPHLPLAALEGRTEGIIALSGCRQGLLCQLIDDDRLGEAERVARRLQDLFGPDSLFMELQRHLVRGDERRVRCLTELAERLDVGIVATGNVHYHERFRHRLQDAMVAIKHRTTLEASHQLRRPNSEFFLRRPDDMAEKFADLPTAILATRQIAERCRDFDLTNTKDLGYRFPDFRRAPVVRDGAEDALRRPPSVPPSNGGRLRGGGGSGDESAGVAGALAREEPREESLGDLARSQPANLPPFDGGIEGGARRHGPPHSPDPDQQPSALSTLRASSADDADAVLEEFCWEALGVRYPEGSEYRADAAARLREELRLIHLRGLAGFFLVYRDLLNMAREVAAEVRGAGTARGASGLPPGRGRGSSVSSIVCYLIGLSHVDPVKNNLFLGRFLNEAMSSVPDIDLDFARDIREALILRVYEHYGHDHAALVCSFSTYHIRSAVRDLGKVLGLPAPLLDKLAKLSEYGSAANVEAEMKRLPELKDFVDTPAWRHLIDLAKQINQFPRHMSQHVGGMIISSRPIIEMVPVQPAAMPGRYICQWDKDSCDDAKFIKVDFLALGMLSLVEECLELIWQHHEKKVDLSQIDHDDPVIYDQICAGDTVGLFQIESRAQIQMLPRTQPRNLDDLAIEVAIVRPGPIVGGAVNPYVRQRERQRKGATDFPVDHECLREVLRDTLGVVLFQDQVMQVASALAGFTDGQADGLRRAMSRRRSAEAMQAFRDDFLNGAHARGVDEAIATKVFEKLVGFSEFGFPKSHAAAFAVLAFQSAWLRFHYPAEYLCALFNNQPMGFYAPHVLVGDARRHGVSVLPVDVNRSEVHCSVEYQEGSRLQVQGSTGQVSSPKSQVQSLRSQVSGPKPDAPLAAVRLGLDRMRGLGADMAEAIAAERAARGSFADLEAFVRRMSRYDLKRPAMENLILVGAFPSFNLNRRELLWQYGLLSKSPKSKVPSLKSKPAANASRKIGRGSTAKDQLRQRDLRLETLDLGLSIDQDMIPRPEMTAWERMVTDYHTLGLSPSLHPLRLMRSRLPADIVPADGLRDVRDGSMVRVAGVVVCRQRPGTAQGFTFLLIEDETGLINAIVRPALYEKARPIVRGEAMVIARGRLQTRDGNINVLVEEIAALREPELPPAPEPTVQDPVMPRRPQPRIAPAIPSPRSFH